MVWVLGMAGDVAFGAHQPPAQLIVNKGALVKNRAPRPHNTPEGYNWWHYGVTLHETSGRSGITLTGWTKCYVTKDDRGCENVRDNFEQLYGTARIPPGGSVQLIRPAWVWADRTGDTYKVEARYWGVDDFGHTVEGGYAFQMRSD